MTINKTYKQIQAKDNRFIVCYGGAGSGKSHFIAQLIFLSLIGCLPVKWLVLRKVATTLKDSVFALIKDVIYREGAEGYFKINKSDKSIECLTGNTLIMAGLDDPEKIKGVHGVSKVWIEEASEFSEKDFNQLNLRLRGEGEKKQYYLSFNPIDIDHWLKARFFDRTDEDAFVLHTTYNDNAFLDAEYKKELESYREKDYYYYQVYCLGEWGAISSARVFHNYVVEDFEYKIEDFKNVCYGMDFGFVHASTLIGCGFRDGELYVFGEQYFKELTNSEFILKIDESEHNKSNLITADSAEPDRIKQFRQGGYRMATSKKGKGSLRNGIDFLKGLKIHIHTRCPNTARELQGFKRRELRDGTITEDFVELNDDCIAGLRYGTEHLWSKPGAIKKSRITAGALGV